MKSLANFALFQIGWLIAVEGASRDRPWPGPATVAVVLLVHLALVGPRERAAQLAYALAVGLAGTALDSGLHALGVTGYAARGEPWPDVLTPPWITALWVAFATLPRFSLAWLRGRWALAAALGALGGPLSYYGGARLGAVLVNDDPLRTWIPLAAEYALVTPLLLALAPRPRTPGATG